MLFDRATKMPEPGSPMEIVHLLVWKGRQNIEFHKSRSLLQALLSQKDAEDKTILQAFEDLREAFFPFDKNQKKDEAKRVREQLTKEVVRGPLSVVALEDPNRKKMASRLVRGREELARKSEAQRSGKMIQMDPQNKARNRTRGAS